jgi:hypothetical protein
VPADAVRLTIGADDHCQRVPAHQTLDAPLDVAIPRIRDLLVRRNRVDVRGGRLVRQAQTRQPRAAAQRLEQTNRAGLVALTNDVVERLQPLAGFDGLERGRVCGGDVLHDMSPLRSMIQSILELLTPADIS